MSGPKILAGTSPEWGHHSQLLLVAQRCICKIKFGRSSLQYTTLQYNTHYSTHHTHHSTLQYTTVIKLDQPWSWAYSISHSKRKNGPTLHLSSLTTLQSENWTNPEVDLIHHISPGVELRLKLESWNNSAVDFTHHTTVRKLDQPWSWPNSQQFISHKHTTFKPFDQPWSWAHLYD